MCIAATSPHAACRLWRRAGDDALHSGGLRRHHAHVRGRHHRVSPAGNVAADAVDGNIFVAQDHAGNGFYFHVLKRGALLQREVADLLLREFDVVDHLHGQRAQAFGNIALGEAEGCGRPLVELFRILAQSRFAAGGDIRKDAFDSFANLRAALGLRFGRLTGLEVADHAVLPNLNPTSIRRSSLDARLRIFPRGETVSGEADLSRLGNK